MRPPEPPSRRRKGPGPMTEASALALPAASEPREAPAAVPSVPPRPRAGRPPRARGAPGARLPLRARPHRARLPVLDPRPLGLGRRRPVLRALGLPDHARAARAAGRGQRYFIFYARRVLRIFPLYYFALTLALCLFLTIPAARPEAAKLAAPAWYYRLLLQHLRPDPQRLGGLRLPRPLLEPVRRGAVLPRLAVPRLQPAGTPAARRHAGHARPRGRREAAARRRRRRLGADLRQHAHADRTPSRSAGSAPTPRRTGSAAARTASTSTVRPASSPCWSSPTAPSSRACRSTPASRT